MLPSVSRYRPILLHAGIGAFFLLPALIITWPLITVFTTRYAGHPFSDSYELARHIWWLAHALQTGQPLFEQPLLAWPDGLNGALLWSYPLQSFPAWLFSYAMPLPAAFNLSLVIRLALNGWSAFVLARYLTGSARAALVAGAVFMTYPTFQGHLAAGHTGLLALWPVPLYAYALLRLRASPARRWVVLAALMLVVSSWGSTQLLVFTVFPITVVFTIALLWRREWRALVRLLAAAILGVLPALAFALPLLLATLAEPPYIRLTTGVVEYSADLLAAIAPSYLHPLHRDNALAAGILGVDPFESAAYIGLVAGGLALVGVLARRQARWWLALALLAWVWSLGPLLKVGGELASAAPDGYSTRIVLPWAAFYDLPAISITRSPGRFNFTVALAVAMMAAYGVRALESRLNRRWLTGLALILVALVAYDYQFWWNAAGTLPDLPTIDGVVPGPIRALAGRDDIRAVLDVPWQHPLAAKEGLWLQTGHQQPLIAGHMTRQTPVDPAKLSILEQTLNPALLDAAGADIIILHREWDDATGHLEAALHQRLGNPLYEDARFAVFDIPPPDAAAPFIALPPAETTLRDRLETYVYAPDEMTVTVATRLHGDGQNGTLELDEQPAAQWTTDGEQTFEATLSLAPGYHRLALVLTPPCPPQAPASLECRAVEVERLEVTPAARTTASDTFLTAKPPRDYFPGVLGDLAVELLFPNIQR